MATITVGKNYYRFDGVKGVENLASIIWPGPITFPPGNVTSMRVEHPEYTYIKYPGGIAWVTGNGRYVSAGAKVLQASPGNPVEFRWVDGGDEKDLTYIRPALDRFTARYPYRLNWTDRRPIGKSFPNGHVGGTNRWNWTWTTQASFEAGFHSHIDASVRSCKSVNAQGLIVWSIEGQYMGHPISYVGDPERHEQFAKEVNRPLAKALFDKIQQAGLLPGVCIRPQRLSPTPGNVFGWWQYDLGDVDYMAELRRKITFARNEFGCRLFYIDSCMRIQKAGPVGLPPFEMFAQLAAEFPDCLMIPEQSTPAWASVCAPFEGLLNDMPGDLRYCYPQSFRVMHGQNRLTSYPAKPEEYAQLKASVAAGNVATFNAWYEGPDLKVVRQVVSEAV
jgi:hypothetical protein